MKKIIILFISLFSFGTLVHAQGGKDIRTNSTRIADFLRQLPAENSSKLNAVMQEVAGLDEAGLIDLVSRLVPVANNENAKLEYAISGFSGYVSLPGNDAMRTKTALAYSKALSKNTDPEARSFIMSQLGWIGQDESVDYLKAFLGDTRLVGPASRALVEIGSDPAKAALVGALADAKEENTAALLEAVGQIKAKEALSIVTSNVSNANEGIQKTALYALASIADPSSADLLSQAASKSQYRYDNVHSFEAYIDYIHNLKADGNDDLAEKLAKKLIQETRNQETQARIAALQVLVDIQGESSLPILAKAAKDQNKVFRVAALKMGEPYMVASQSAFWLKQIKKSSPEGKAELINLIDGKKMPLLIPVLKTQLKSSSPQVKLAAIKALGKMNGVASLPDFIAIAKNGNAQEVAVVKEALLTMEGESIQSEIAKALPESPKNAQIAFLSVLGARGAKAEYSSIYSFLESTDQEIKAAAFEALTTAVGEEQLPQLFALLNASTDSAEAVNLQKAIIYGLREIDGKDAQTGQVISMLATAPSSQKPLYYSLLGAIGGDKALLAVQEAYEAGDASNRAAAMQSLSSWKEETALPILYQIVKNTKDQNELDLGLKGLLRLTNASKTVPMDQKVIILKEAMQYSQTLAQKRAVLRAVSAHKSFPALAFAGKFIEDPELAQSSANAVMEIALADPSINGDLVKKHLNTTLEVLKGQDSEYLREAIRKHLSEMNDEVGFVEIFNGKDLTGWKGLVENPIARRKMDAKTLAAKQKVADRVMNEGWVVKDGELLFLGKGDNLATTKDYGNIEMWVDWKIYDDGHKDGDAGIYLKGTPQVQIWDTSRVDAGAQVGSGGLYNNQKNESKPLVVADNALGEWNAFYIKMIDDKVTVYLNGVLVTDNVLLENYWDRNLPLFAKEQIELQAHGSRIGYRDIYIHELPTSEVYELTADEKKEGFEILFDGTSMDKWMGNTTDYSIVGSELVIQPNEGSGGNLFTKEEFGDFVYRFEFKLTEGANNGLGVRAPLEGDVAYQGIEIQILDDNADIYKNLKDYQYHGSLYGVMKAKRGYLKPLGEWNYEEVQVKGDHFKVILNGTVIIDGSISDAKANGTLDGEDHPGLFRKSGHIAFLGHGSKVYFKNIRVKKL